MLSWQGALPDQVLGIKDPDLVGLKTTELNLQRQHCLVTQLQQRRFVFVIDVTMMFQARAAPAQHRVGLEWQPDQQCPLRIIAVNLRLPWCLGGTDADARRPVLHLPALEDKDGQRNPCAPA
jgi:hypothetical protein